MTSRVEDSDVPIPGWGGALVTLLLEPGQADRLQDAPKPSADASTVALVVAMVWGGPTAAVSSPGGQFIGWNTTAPSTTPAKEASVQIQSDADAAAPPIELAPLRADRPSFVALPAGQYHVRVSHPRAICRAFGVNSENETAGLSGNVPGKIELPVLQGSSAWMVSQCWCYPMHANQQLVDLASCSFEPGDAAP